MTDSIQFSCPIGLITLSANQNVLTKIFLDRVIFKVNPKAIHNSILGMAKLQILEYLDGKRKTFDIELDWVQLHGFQLEVLKITNNIPFGETLTYGQIASLLKKPNASRAVGAALARNPLPILIPCHRVVAADGHLTGYLGIKGLTTKKWLLELEGHQIVGEKLD